jgi:hypothetical protein
VWIAYHDVCDGRLEQIVKPSGPRTFFQGNVQVAAQSSNDSMTDSMVNLPAASSTATEMNRVKAIYRSWAIPCRGQSVYGPRYREEWLNKIAHRGVRCRAKPMSRSLKVTAVAARVPNCSAKDQRAPPLKYGLITISISSPR